jgi:hypothetical protein
MKIKELEWLAVKVRLQAKDELQIYGKNVGQNVRIIPLSSPLQVCLQHSQHWTQSQNFLLYKEEVTYAFDGISYRYKVSMQFLPKSENK